MSYSQRTSQTHSPVLTLKSESESEVSQLCLTLCNPMDGSLPGSSIRPGKSTRVGFHFLLQGIFLVQGSNPGLPHCRQTFFTI